MCTCPQLRATCWGHFLSTLFFRPSGMHCWDFHTHRQGQLHSIFQAGKAILAKGISVSMGIHPGTWLPIGKLVLKKSSGKQPRTLAFWPLGKRGLIDLRDLKFSFKKMLFYAQASAAAELGIPLILHCVKSYDLLLEYLKSAKNPPCIIWHGWNQKPELARQLLPFPVFFSFGKHILHPGSNAAEWLAACPLDRVFFETDDSELKIESIYQAASLILQLPKARLAEQVIANWNAISKRKIS